MTFTAVPVQFLQFLLCLAVCGCGAVEDTFKPAAVSPPVAKVLPNKSEPKRPAVENVDDKSAPVISTEAEPQAEKQAFEPPYPHRENLFLAPKRSAVHKDTPGNVQQSVELLGFANVQGPRVILSIDGIVVPMPEGATQSGIEVISIQPPAVVLQRDRERWQATLEN